ncbi:hypothetical protein [Klebsiella pneumoniae]|uniref:hypothetical protein n=1 Tax=Klebsiella pneumoniae TaxID=573 RepID=UPI0034DAEF7A
MIEEKILILYPTLVQAGLAITAYMAPTPLITVGSFDSPLSFYITMAVFLDSSKEGRCEQVPDMRSSYSSGAHPRGTS